jgi:hypothetical protein
MEYFDILSLFDNSFKNYDSTCKCYLRICFTVFNDALSASEVI